ncbi:MAG: hypothetical protein JWQ35_1048 [Bacteriovoracaceae bacterium]|nr:hypothetical protein [Bacteriovoracaceae bacterium]
MKTISFAILFLLVLTSKSFQIDAAGCKDVKKLTIDSFWSGTDAKSIRETIINNLMSVDAITPRNIWVIISDEGISPNIKTGPIFTLNSLVNKQSPVMGLKIEFEKISATDNEKTVLYRMNAAPGVMGRILNQISIQSKAYGTGLRAVMFVDPSPATPEEVKIFLESQDDAFDVSNASDDFYVNRLKGEARSTYAKWKRDFKQTDTPTTIRLIRIKDKQIILISLKTGGENFSSAFTLDGALIVGLSQTESGEPNWEIPKR